MIGGILVGLLVLAALFFLFWRFWFLRDPEREIPQGENMVSPADGRIIKVAEIGSGDLKISKGALGKVKTFSGDVKDAGYLVSIFMSPLDVHVQRAPVGGRIASVRYNKGKFLAASSLEALSNESNEILIEDIDSCKVVQIAGFVARRIECFVKKDDLVVKGQRLGRINLGSQVSLVIPKNVELKVKEGERVKAGSTVLAEFL